MRFQLNSEPILYFTVPTRQSEKLLINENNRVHSILHHIFHMKYCLFELFGRSPLKTMKFVLSNYEIKISILVIPAIVVFESCLFLSHSRHSSSVISWKKSFVIDIRSRFKLCYFHCCKVIDFTERSVVSVL